MPENPFDDSHGRFSVLANDASELSLWPTGLPIPAGWAVVVEEADRERCLGYVEDHWNITAARREKASARAGTAPRTPTEPWGGRA